MMRRSTVFFFAFALESSTAIKECIQPVRTRTQDPPCPHPLVPETIHRDYDGKSSWGAGGGGADSQSSKKRKPYNEYHLDSQQPREPCSLVAEAIYADLPVFDVVLLNNGMCNPSMNIERGVFGPEEARDFLPYNNELIVLLLHGKEIVHALEHGMSQSLDHGVSGAYPKTAGIRYDVTEELVEGPMQGGSQKHRRVLSQIEILSHYCTWEALEYDRMYSVLTNEYMGKGGDGYIMLPIKAKSKTLTGVREAESFWFHAQSVCVVEMPWRTMDDAEAEAAENMKIVYKVGTIANARNKTTLLQSE
jgi:hypothetical protein